MKSTRRSYYVSNSDAITCLNSFRLAVVSWDSVMYCGPLRWCAEIDVLCSVWLPFSFDKYSIIRVEVRVCYPLISLTLYSFHPKLTISQRCCRVDCDRYVPIRCLSFDKYHIVRVE